MITGLALLAALKTLTPVTDGGPHQSAVSTAVGQLAGMDIDVNGVSLAAATDDGPPVLEAGDDATIEVDLSGDPEVDDALLREHVAAAEEEYPQFSDYVADAVTDFETYGVEDLSDNYIPPFDADVSVEGSVLTFVIPADDVTATTNWWQGALIATMAAALGFIAGAICITYFPEAAPVCGFLEGFITGALDNLFTALADHDTIDQEKVGDILARAIVSGLEGAGAGKVLQAHAPHVLEWVAAKTTTAGANIKLWWKTMGVVISSGGDVLGFVSERLGSLLRATDDGTGGVEKPALRLLPVGDSITYGAASSDGNGYRKLLWDALDAQGLEPDFIGCNASGDMSDPQHEGNRGYLIEAMEDPAVRDATLMRPNVVTLMAGTNDIYRDSEVAKAPGQLGALIDQLQAASPGVAIAVATIVPVKNDSEAQKRRNAYNEQVRLLVEDRQDSGQKVMLAEMGPMTESMLYDTLHPNDVGYAYIAGRFEEAVTAMVHEGWVVDTADGTANADACVMAGGGWQELGRIAEGPINPDSSSAGVRGQVRLADFDGNGKSDYAVVTDTGAVYLWTKITGGWVNRGKVAAGNGVPGRGSQVRFADLDGDHDADYLVVDAYGAVRAWRNDDVWINGGSAWHYMGTIAQGTGTGGGTDLHFADLDGDLDDDYLVVHDDGSIGAWINDDVFVNGHSAWTGLGLIAAGVGAPGSKVRLADLDGDKDADYLIVHSDGSAEAWLNDSVPEDLGKGWRSIGKIAAGTGMGGDAVQFADADADRDADYFVIDSDGTVTAWENDKVATRSDKENGFKKLGLYGDHLLDAAGNARSVRFADLDGDGDDDYLLVGPKGEVEAWRNDDVATRGSNAWIKIGRVADGVSPGATERVVFADYNGDGRDDYLVVDDTNGRVRGWRNDSPFTNGAAAWAGLGAIAAGPSTAPGREVQFADIDGDGDDDYLLVAVDHSVTAWKNNGTDAPGGGGWAAQGLLAQPQEATVTQKTLFADMNTDKRADYILRDPGENNALYGWTNLGAFANQWSAKKKVAYGVVMGFPVEVTLADISGDGLDDYLVVDPTNGATRAWLNIGGNQADP
ncbi:FG-GAP-like repeat-containing protein [Streptomyces sp. NPDC090106]|uniref:FG-GAP-like repeat-containing protein n=1 Tax=Streptomyces sp. NPDC090106 TaxID=3365946 RepID=UPI003813F576